MRHPDAAPDPARRRLLFGGAARPTAPSDTERVLAVIADSCLAFRGIACMTCRDACPTSAIRFGLAIGGARPRVEADACTGCAECAGICPAGAIALAAAPAHPEAAGA
jgi:ferredoxin-type protein NapF